MQLRNIPYSLLSVNNYTPKMLLLFMPIFYAYIFLVCVIKRNIRLKAYLFCIIISLIIPCEILAQTDKLPLPSNVSAVQENPPIQNNIPIQKDTSALKDTTVPNDTATQKDTTVPNDITKLKDTNKLSANGIATLVMYNLQQKDIIEIIVHSQANLDAIKRAAQNLKNHSVAFKGAHKLEQRMVLAAYIFNSTAITSSNTENLTANASITVKVRLEPDSAHFDAKINKMLQIPDFFTLYENILKSLTTLTKEAAYLINRANITNNKQYMGYNYVLWERITYLAYNIEALWDFTKILPLLEYTWKNPKQTKIKLKRLIQKAPNDALLLTALGEVQLQQELPQDALKNFNKALLISPKLARTLHSRGLAHLRLQHLALAEKDMSDALELYPNITTWLRSRGAVYMLRGKNDLMCLDFESACALGDCDGLKMARQKGLCLNLK